MPLPTTIDDLSTVAGSNYPAGTDSPIVLDDVQRAHAAFIAQLRDGSATIGSEGSSIVGYLPAGTGAVATTVQAKLRESVSVKDFGAVGDGLTDDSAAIQAYVNYVIGAGVRRIFFPFSNGEKYRLASTIVIESSGFGIYGDATTVYDTQAGGYIFGDSGVSVLFNYGNDRTNLASNQLVCEGVSFYSNTGLTQTAIKHAQNNNGPHRGTLLREVSAKGFLNVISFDVANGANLSAATVVVDSCSFTGNTNTVNAVERAFGLRYVGNQSEAGARITGTWDGGITILDNMMEGQSDPITISSNAPTPYIRNNYFEAITGSHIASIRGTNSDAVIDVAPNYVSNPLCTDILKIQNVCRVVETVPFCSKSARKSSLSLIGAILPPGSDLTGDFYVGTDSASYGYGWTNYTRIQPPASSVVKSKVLGAITLNTPFGQTTAAASINGFPATYFSLAATYALGDVLVACALVRVEANGSETPYFLLYNEAFSSTDVTCGQVAFPVSEDGKWFLMFGVRRSSVAGTSAKFRFGSNGTSAGSTSIHVAAVGVNVVPAADFETFNSESRAFSRLFNPYL